MTDYLSEQHPVDVKREDGSVVTELVERVIPVSRRKLLPVDRVRLSSLSNDVAASRLFIRFFYGRVEDGQWHPARLDDGIVISGPNYFKVDLDLDGEIEEHEVLLMCAKLLHWEGELHELDGATLPVEGGPA